MSDLIVEDLTVPQQTLLVSASQARVDRVNVLAYGPPGSGKTFFATTFPKPFFIDTENGLLTARARISRGEIEDFPAIATTDYSTVLEILSAPEYRIPLLFKGSKWEGYVPETVVIDTISTLEGHIFDVVCGQSKSGNVGQPEWNKLKRIMMAIARKSWDCDLNVVMLAHDQKGRNRTADMGPKEAGPLLTGGLVTQFPAQIDILLRMEERYNMGSSEYVAHTVLQDGMPARAQGVALPALLEPPDYATIRAALDQL